MTTIKEAQSTEIWVIGENGLPEETNLYSWVMNFEDREKKMNVEMQIENEFEPDEYIQYRVRYSPMNRHSHLVDDIFETEEEALDWIFNRIFTYDFEKASGWANTEYFYGEKEAENAIIERMADNDSIDIDVAKSIFSKMQKVVIRRAELDKIHRAKIDKEYQERKAFLAVEIPKEAESITIDQSFKDAVKSAGLLTKDEKSRAMTAALKGLLSRNGKNEIKTDFWQVLRILKNKATN